MDLFLKPFLPITEPSNILTEFPIIVFFKRVLFPIIQSDPMRTLDSIIVL